MIKIRFIYLFVFVFFHFSLFAQQTKVEGTVRDAVTGEVIPFAKVRFYDSKIGTLTDTAGYYSIETYYATDSIIVSFSGYISVTKAVKMDQAQVIDVDLPTLIAEIEEVVVRPPDEFPSTILHKKMVKNKPINNKEKLDAYQYELYNKIQFDLNNIGDKFKEREVVQRMSLIMDYLDSMDNGKTYLPVILSESISDFYFKNNPKKKKEVVKAAKITGIENIQLNQFMGDMYVDINVYDNYINMFNKPFISPAANFARNFYRFYLEDSTFIDNQWCYKLRFTPKRQGDLTFEGEMWIHDTTYAVKQVSGTISPWANINYVQSLYFEQKFDMVAPEVWMLSQETLFADFKVTKKTDLYGFFARKESHRMDFVINKPFDDEFYRTDNTVEVIDGANHRDSAYWNSHRHVPLNYQEAGIDQMVDSLNNTRFFRLLRDLTYFSSTGYYPLNKIELGNAYSLLSYNPVEEFRTGLALRTSNKFSRRIELGGKVFYGFGDEKFKYSAAIRYNVTPKKRGMLIVYYKYDIEQIGQSPTAASVGSTFSTLFRTGPLDKLTMVERYGINFEKDVKKDIILFGGFERKEYTPLGLANYVRQTDLGTFDTISKINTSEFLFRFRWAKNEEFLSGAFDRTSIGSRYPIISIQGIFGIKDLLGADYNYQRIEAQMDHTSNLGAFGSIRYGVNGGYIFGTTAYPFLKVHEGNQSYWMLLSAFNKLNFFEFISDKYIGGYLENHWQGLFLDRVPLIRKLKWRLVSGGRIAYGAISDRHSTEMLLPDFTKQFGYVPYAEVNLGIENIFKLGRIDLVWRLTHLDPGMSPLGIRARWAISL